MEEKKIRDGIFDILCFLSSGKANAEQIQSLQWRIQEAVNVFARKEETKRTA